MPFTMDSSLFTLAADNITAPYKNVVTWDLNMGLVVIPRQHSWGQTLTLSKYLYHLCPVGLPCGIPAGLGSHLWSHVWMGSWILPVIFHVFFFWEFHKWMLYSHIFHSTFSPSNSSQVPFSSFMTSFSLIIITKHTYKYNLRSSFGVDSMFLC